MTSPTDPRGHQATPGSAGSTITVPGRRKRRGDKDAVVPDAAFTSYYGRPIVKASPWETDIPVYLFLGGLAGVSSVLGAGADATGAAALRRNARLTALGAISVSFAALVHDLGRPTKFINMLRVAKPSSPMSVGTWILTAYAPLAGLAAAGEVAGRLEVTRSAGTGPRSAHRAGGGRARRLPTAALRLLTAAARPAGVGAAALGPAVATYTAVLLSDTATPSWHEARREMPFLFAASASAAAAGMGLLTAPAAERGAVRRLAVAAAATDLAVESAMERSMGVTAEPLHAGTAGRYSRAARALTAGGGLLAAVGAGRSTVAARVAGAALLAGSAATRFAVFEAGQASARDPRYTVVPQRERLAARQAAAAAAAAAAPPS